MQFIKKHWESIVEKFDTKKNEVAATATANGCVPTTNRLILYYNYYSYYSQKVLMALHEKQLAYEAVAVDITCGEQYSGWFLELNPRGEVPVLLHDARVVPDSGRILDYLEKHLAIDCPPLLNVSGDAKVLRKVEEFRELLDSLPAGVVTMGSFFHPELCGQPKLPFLPSVRNTLKSAEMNNSSNLRRLAEEHPKARTTLLYKAEIHERKHELLADRAQYLDVLGQVDAALALVETQLASQQQGGWLCCEQFTIADIALTVLLERLYVLGLEGRYWSGGKRPYVAAYYRRARERPSYRAAIPSLAFHLRLIVSSQPPAVLGAVTAASLGTLLATLYVVKKIIF